MAERTALGYWVGELSTSALSTATAVMALHIVNPIAHRKLIDRGIVIEAMEDAIQKAARSRYGSETNVKAEINPKTGEIRLARLLEVV